MRRGTVGRCSGPSSSRPQQHIRSKQSQDGDSSHKPNNLRWLCLSCLHSLINCAAPVLYLYNPAEEAKATASSRTVRDDPLHGLYSGRDSELHLWPPFFNFSILAIKYIQTCTSTRSHKNTTLAPFQREGKFI